MNIQVFPYCKKSKKRKNGLAPIYFVLRINSVDKLISTGKVINPDYFNNAKEKVMPGEQNSMSINAFLNAEKSKIEKIILGFQNEDKLITHQVIINAYKGKESKSFIEFAKRELRLESGVISEATVAQHNTSINNLEHYDPGVAISDIDASYLKRYRAYFVSKGRQKNGYSHDFVSIRKFLIIALKQGLIKKNPFKDFKIESEETYRNHLSREEKQALLDALPFFSGKLYHTLLYFLISCETGLRLKDMIMLSNAWVKGDLDKLLVNGNLFLVQHKGKKPNRIPCTDQALRLLSLPVDRPLKQKADRISNDLGEILASDALKKAKITKEISFHCARHTFAILALEKGVSIKAISQVMGHASIKTTEIYAKYVDKSLDNEMAKLNG